MLVSGSLDTCTDEIVDYNLLDSANSQDLTSDEEGCIPEGYSPKLGGFSFNFYKKNSLPGSTPSSSPVNRSKIEASYNKIKKRNDDRINKGVSHKIRKPKVLKKKEVRKNRAKQSCSRLREVKMPPRMPANRCLLKPGEKSKRHLLSSPGMSLLECPDSAYESSQETKKKFFTTRSRDPATIQISKTIKLAALDGTVTMKHRVGGFEKKNIGHTLEIEIEKKIAATTLNSPSNGIEKLDRIAQMSSTHHHSSRPIPTRFPGSPSPCKNKLKSKEVTTFPKSGTPVRSSPRRLQNRTNILSGSPCKLRKSPRKKIDLLHCDSNFKQDHLDSQSWNRVSPLRLESSKAMEKRINTDEDLEDLELVLDNMRSIRHEEDEIISTLIKENVSPDKILNSPRRSFRRINSNSPICFSKRPNSNSHKEPSSTPRSSPQHSTGKFGKANENSQLINLSNLPENKVELIEDSLTNLSAVNTTSSTKNFKYFPIFDSGRKNKNSALNLEENTLKSVPQKRFVMKKSDSSQLVLDAGQKQYGATFCKSCGLMYEIGDPEDEASHIRHHEAMIDSLRFNGWKNEKQVTNVDYLGGRIIKISPKDPAYQWKKIEEVLKCVDSDLGFSENGIKRQESTFAYLYILDKLVVGCLIAEIIENAYKVVQNTTILSPNDSGKLICCSEVPQKVCLGISRIWVLSKYRRVGVASRLVDAMRANFIIGHYLSVSQFAFSDPTQFGMAFAEKYTKRSDFLVYRREKQ